MLAALINGFVVSVPLAAVVWLVLGVSRRWVNAATRYAIWWIVLAIVICLPIRYVPFRESRSTARAAATPAPSPAMAIVQPRPVSSSSIPVARVSAPWFPVRVAPGSWSAWIMGAWAITAFVMLLRLLISYALLGKMKRQAPDAPEGVAAAALSALERFGVTRRVRVAVLNDAVSPMVAGPFGPTILLPAVVLESMDDAEIGQICLHEAAHLARRDDWALMVQRLIEVLFALHPLVRWLGARINLEREIACDDLVISVTGSARPYAACLTRIAELAGGLSRSPAVAAVSDERSHLTRRVEMLLDKTRHAGTRLLGARLALLGCGLALATLLAARTPGVLVLLAPQRTIVAPPSAPPVAAPQPAAQARPPARPPARAAQPVRIAVNVTDPMNHFVTGLDADAFHVFENGVERKVVDFAPQAESVSIAIVWEQKGELSDLRHRLSQLMVFPSREPPPKVRIEPRLWGFADGVGVFANVPGSHVLPIPIGENQSIADGFESALDQLRGTPPEQSAVVLVVDPASWPVDRIRTVTNAAAARIYVLGVVSRGSARSSEATPPVLISRRSASLEQYPTVTADEVAASLNWISPELHSEYFIGYVPGGAGGREVRTVDVRLTPPVGLPALTARVSEP